MRGRERRTTGARGRRRQLAWFAGVTTVVLGSGVLHSLHAQRDFSKVELKVTPVAGNVHMLTGSGGNIGLSAGDDGVLMIDDQFAPLAGRIEAEIAKLGKGDLAFLVNTHFHGDHTGGNARFGVDATIVAHENVRTRVMTPQEFTRGTSRAQPPEGWPVVTFRESVTLHFNGEAVEVIHFPTGHTDGDSVIFFTGSNVVHMGDHFFSGSFPFVDLEAGGDVEGLTRNVAAVLERVPDDVKIIPGHGSLSGAQELRDYHEMLEETTDIVRKGMEQGKSRDDIKAEGLPEKWQSWGEGFINVERWVDTVYASLSRDGT